MAETSRKKTLPLAVLAAPALAFGSLTFAAAPAMAVPADEVEQILNEDGITIILVDAGEGVEAQDEDGEPFLNEEGEPVTTDGLMPFTQVEGEFFVGPNGELYPMDEFDHATPEQYEEAGLQVPELLQETEIVPDINVQGDSIVPGAEVTVIGSGFTPDTEVVVTLNGEEIGTTTATADGDIEELLELPEDIEPGTYELVATGSVDGEVANDTLNVEEASVDEEETPGEDEAPGDGEETPGDDETPEPAVEPALTVAQDEILLEDFVGDSEEGTGVLHRVVGAAPGSTVEYTVETPNNIVPFDSSGIADEEGVLEFWIHGYDIADPSVYLGNYTTTVTFEDVDGETQELSADFTVVDGTEGNDEGTDGDDQDDTGDEVTPVVDTEDPEDSTADDEDDAPALGSAEQLADTGASGAQLAWIAGGLLALGGAFVLFANRARWFGRKN